MKHIVSVCLLFLVSFVYAVIPQQINVQGKLSDLYGAPLDGNFKFVFNLYTQEVGGSSVFSETTESLNVKNGIFNYLLGTNTPLNLAFGGNYWLGISVNNETEMTPRQKIVSVGNSYKALNSDTSDWLVDASHIKSGTISDARLSINVPLKDTNNYWDGIQTFDQIIGVKYDPYTFANDYISYTSAVIGNDEGDCTALEVGQLMTINTSYPRMRTIVGYDERVGCGYVSAGRSWEAWTSLELQNYGGNVGIFTVADPATERLDIGQGNLRLRNGNIILNTGNKVDGVDISHQNATWVGSNSSQTLTPATYYDVVTTVNYTSGGVTVTWSAPYTERPSVTTSIILNGSYSDLKSYDVQWTSLTATGGTFRVNAQIASDASSGEAGTNEIAISIHAIGK
jgi:hypothetical protein